jgi:hypothetical protein
MNELDLLTGVLNYPPFLADIGEGARREIVKNFQVGGRYGDGLFGGGTKKWKPSRRVLERGGQTLIDTGNLYRNITIGVKPDAKGITIEVESMAYGIQHQTGTRKLPARPWATLPDSFVQDVILRAFQTHLTPDKVVSKLEKLMGLK